MHKNYEELENFFVNIEDIKETIVIKYLEKIARKYHKYESSKLQKEIQNEL